MSWGNIAGGITQGFIQGNADRANRQKAERDQELYLQDQAARKALSDQYDTEGKQLPPNAPALALHEAIRTQDGHDPDVPPPTVLTPGSLVDHAATSVGIGTAGPPPIDSSLAGSPSALPPPTPPPAQQAAIRSGVGGLPPTLANPTAPPPQPPAPSPTTGRGSPGAATVFPEGHPMAVPDAQPDGSYIPSTPTGKPVDPMAFYRPPSQDHFAQAAAFAKAGMYEQAKAAQAAGYESRVNGAITAAMMAAHHGPSAYDAFAKNVLGIDQQTTAHIGADGKPAIGPDGQPLVDINRGGLVTTTSLMQDLAHQHGMLANNPAEVAQQMDAHATAQGQQMLALGEAARAAQQAKLTAEQTAREQQLTPSIVKHAEIDNVAEQQKIDANLPAAQVQELQAQAHNAMAAAGLTDTESELKKNGYTLSWDQKTLQPVMYNPAQHKMLVLDPVLGKMVDSNAASVASSMRDFLQQNMKKYPGLTINVDPATNMPGFMGRDGTLYHNPGNLRQAADRAFATYKGAAAIPPRTSPGAGPQPNAPTPAQAIPTPQQMVPVRTGRGISYMPAPQPAPPPRALRQGPIYPDDN